MTMNFADLPENYRDYGRSKAVVLPIPFCGDSARVKGVDGGVSAILAASAHLGLYDIETDSEVFLKGICTLPPVACPPQYKEMISAVHKSAGPLFKDDKLVVGIGGEHSVSIGLVQAAHEVHSDLSVLQFDAHADRQDTADAEPYGHGCVMTRISERCQTVQVGIRSMDKAEKNRIDPDRLVLARDVHRHGVDAAFDALDLLSDSVYITVDLDVLDPSCMPATSTPEPGGIDWYMLNSLIGYVAREKNIVGMDIVELLPLKDNRAPDFLAAKLLYRMLSMAFCYRY